MSTSNSNLAAAKLTAQATQTLSLLRERMRVPGLPALHMNQIVRNMNALRAGIRELEQAQASGEEAKELRRQYEHLQSMLGKEGVRAGVESLDEVEAPESSADASNTIAASSAASSSLVLSPSPSPPSPTPTPPHHDVYVPYKDEPDPAYADEQSHDPAELLQTQRQLMDDQDTHLTHLSTSLSRQHHISLQISDELDTHVGLLDALDGEVDGVGSRLGRARGALDRVERGIKGNASTVMIAGLILVLLLLIIVFKT